MPFLCTILSRYKVVYREIIEKMCIRDRAIGAGLPVLIGIFTASVMEQEQNAGDCLLYTSAGIIPCMFPLRWAASVFRIL